MTTVHTGHTTDLYGAAGAAAYHDLAMTDGTEIVELNRSARRTAGPILELAAGSGRLTIPLLTLGRPVVALDLSTHLLEILQRRLAEGPAAMRARCTVVHGDMTAFVRPERFGAIVLGTTSISLLDAAARRRLYGCVTTHLAPGGRFLVTAHRQLHDGAPVDTLQVLPGASGREYTLAESWLGPDTRRVTIRPTDPGDRPIAFTSVVRDLAPDLIVAELTRAGLAVAARRTLSTVSGGESALLEATR